MRNGIVAAAVSNDVIGTSWAIVAGVPNFDYEGVAASSNGQTIVAVGDASKIARSITGINGTFSDVSPSGLNDAGVLKGIDTDNAGNWFATYISGNSTRGIYSVDNAATWQPATLNITGYKVRWVPFLSLWIATDDTNAGRHPWWSANMIDWTQGTGDAGYTLGLTFDATTVVAFGDTNALKTSPDGKVWTSHNTADNAQSWYGGANYSTSIIGVASGGVSSYSTDHAATNTAGTGLDSGTYSDVAASSTGDFYCCGIDPTHKIGKSTNLGHNWSMENTPNANANALQGICAAGVHMVAVGPGGIMIKK